jgi:hypothetical protein
LAIVLGYHGCDVPTAQKLLSGSPFEPSNNVHDWLGTGSYFWEADIQRAHNWALERRPRSPCVVGAVIDLGNCLDLTQQAGILAVKEAYQSYVELQTETNQPVAQNKAATGTLPEDRVLRLLDRAVIDHIHTMYRVSYKRTQGRVREFDTVRALFPEGVPLYENSGFREKTHIQIAVRKPEQVLGVFRVPAWRLRELNLPDFYDSFQGLGG